MGGVAGKVRIPALSPPYTDHECFGALALCSSVAPLVKCKMVFDFHDEDCSNTLSKHELEMVIMSSVRGMAKMLGTEPFSLVKIEAVAEWVFKQVDRDANGFLSRDEWMTFCKSTSTVQQYFRRIDEIKDKSSPKPEQAPSPPKRGGGKKRVINQPPFTPGKGPVLSIPRSMNNTHPISPMKPSPPRSSKSTGAKGGRGGGRGGAGMVEEKKEGGATMDLELLKQIFSGIDSNLDGIIDVGEFYLSLKGTGLEDSALALFNKIDKDRNGQLTMKELVLHLFPFAGDDDIENIMAWVKDGSGTATQGIWSAGEEEDEFKKMFRGFDKNGDNRITLKELASVMSEVHGLEKDEVVKLFQDLGKSKRDIITQDEFAELMTQFTEGGDLGGHKIGANPGGGRGGKGGGGGGGGG
ncbi:hypothetical protein TeGR_g4081, partial [Tetraparma gracilis]